MMVAREDHGVAQPDRLAQPTSPGKRLRWVQRGGWAIADQGLFALSNFAVSVLLARWLAPDEYGLFTLGYSLFLLLSTVHSGLLTEPMLVFGPGKYQHAKSAYLDILLRSHWIGTAAVAVSLSVVAAALRIGGRGELTGLLLTVALITPFILLQWLLRRSCYMQLEPRLAVRAGILYMAILIPSQYLLYRWNWLSSISALALMGVASALSALAILIAPRSSPGNARDVRLGEVTTDHWRYGRWALGTGAISWIPGNLFYFLLPTWGGLSATATFKALVNLIMPVLHTYVALSTLMTPALVRIRGGVDFKSTIRRLLWLFTCLSTLYWLLLGGFNHQVVAWLYRGRYTADSGLLWILGLITISGAVVSVLGSALRAEERVSGILACYLISAGVAMTVGVGLISMWGIKGAAVAMVLCTLSTAVGMARIFLLRRNGN
jgi:O-antigen/teichoic acid export membrane protein